MNRKELREKIMIVLYQINMFDDLKLDYDLSILLSDEKIKDDTFSERIINGVLENKEKIKTIANKNLNNWEFDKIDKCAKSIMEMAIYEFIEKVTPKKVVINEAIELAKKYSTLEVKNMINASLDKIKGFYE